MSTCDILGPSRHVFSDLAEFSSVPNSMFTVFRCYTGDCTTTEGNSIPEVLRQQFGAVFMTSYMVFTVPLQANGKDNDFGRLRVRLGLLS